MYIYKCEITNWNQTPCHFCWPQQLKRRDVIKNTTTKIDTLCWGLRPIALPEKKLLTRFWATIAWRIPLRWSTMWLTSPHSVKEEMEHKMVHFVCEDLCQRWDHNIENLFGVDSFLGGEVHTRSEEWGSTLRHFLKFCINSHSVKCVTGNNSLYANYPHVWWRISFVIGNAFLTKSFPRCWATLLCLAAFQGW